MTDTEKLRKLIDECGYKLRFVAEKIGLTYQGFLNKVQNKSEFTASEIKDLSDFLHMTDAQRNAIFFGE